MMTIESAYARLKERWPRTSFSISVEVWHHDHSESTGDAATTAIQWAIWDGKEETHHYGPTLDVAMAMALGCEPDVAVVDRQIVWAKDRSGYEIIGPLTKPKKETL